AAGRHPQAWQGVKTKALVGSGASSWVERRADSSRPRFAMCAGPSFARPNLRPQPYLPLVVAALLTTARAANPSVYAAAKSAVVATFCSVICASTFSLFRCIGSYPGGQLPLLRRVLLGDDARVGSGRVAAVVANFRAAPVVTTAVRIAAVAPLGRRKHFLVSVRADDGRWIGFERPRRLGLAHTATDDGAHLVRSRAIRRDSLSSLDLIDHGKECHASERHGHERESRKGCIALHGRLLHLLADGAVLAVENWRSVTAVRCRI